MAYIREETIGRFTDEELLQMFKESLDELEITYEEGPGDWSDFLRIDPADLDAEEHEESYTLRSRPADRSRYQAKAPADYHFGITVGKDSLSLTAGLGHMLDQELEDGPVLTAA